MSLSFDPTIPFLALLLVYMVYSEWAHLDSRYLVGASLVLLVATAVVDAAGATGQANVLAVYVFYLLAGGVLLLLVDHVREERAEARRRTARASAGGPTAPAEEEGQTSEAAVSTRPQELAGEPTATEEAT